LTQASRAKILSPASTLARGVSGASWARKPAAARDSRWQPAVLQFSFFL
jgi:hypothetical protein